MIYYCRIAIVIDGRGLVCFCDAVQRYLEPLMRGMLVIIWYCRRRMREGKDVLC